MTAPAHPQRCDTCNKKDCVFGEKWKSTWHTDVYYFINKFGCASYSSIQSELTKQCKTCKRKGLRDCVYHGYPDDAIPISCSYKIGNTAIDTIYDVQTFIPAKSRDQVLLDAMKCHALDIITLIDEYYTQGSHEP